jgi:hypothetical protein
MFCPWILFNKLYKEGVFSCVLTLKYMCQFGMNSRKLNLKGKNRIFRKNDVLRLAGTKLVDKVVVCIE